MVNCSVPEEKAPIHFTIEKFKLHTKGVKQKREKTSQNQNFVTLEFTVEEQDHVISFQCQAGIVSGTNVEKSVSVRSELVTVTGQSPTLLLAIFTGLLVLSGGKEPRIGERAGAFWLGCCSQHRSESIEVCIFSMWVRHQEVGSGGNWEWGEPGSQPSLFDGTTPLFFPPCITKALNK